MMDDLVARYNRGETIGPYTLPVAARILGLKHDSLRKQAGRGALHAYKIGRDWVVDFAEVIRYSVENQRKRK
jgi:hypothetical protein